MTNNLETLNLKDLPFLNKNLKRIDKAIIKSLPPKNYSKISKAIHYSVLNGGKRIRPQLVLLMAEALKVDVSPKTIDLMAAAGELIHCYSLIHDDLPSMDDDDFRRGKPSCHKKFDEATAILAGDAIQPLALEIFEKFFGGKDSIIALSILFKFLFKKVRSLIFKFSKLFIIKVF